MRVIIISTTVNNTALMTPTAGTSNTGKTSGENMLIPGFGETLLSSLSIVSMLFGNTENGIINCTPANPSNPEQAEQLLQTMEKDKKKVCFELLGFNAINGIAINQTDNTFAGEPVGGEAVSSVGAVGSETGISIPTIPDNTVYEPAAVQTKTKTADEVKQAIPIMQEAIPEVLGENIGKVNTEEEPIPVKADIASTQKTGKEQAEQIVQPIGAEKQSDYAVSFKNSIRLENIDTKQVKIEPVIIKAEKVQDENCFSGIEAIRTELEVKNGFRQSAVGVSQKAENVGISNTDTENKDFSITEKKVLSVKETEKTGKPTEMNDPVTAVIQKNTQVHDTVHAGTEVQIPEKQASDRSSIVTQLEAPIRREAAKGINTSFRIKLKPEGLGEVTVDLSHESGGLNISIKTELSSTKELISEGLDSLRSSLAADTGAKAVQLTSLTVEQDSRSFAASYSGGTFSGGRQNNQSDFTGSSFRNYPDNEEKEKILNVARYRTGLIDYIA